MGHAFFKYSLQPFDSYHLKIKVTLKRKNQKVLFYVKGIKFV